MTHALRLSAVLLVSVIVSAPPIEAQRRARARPRHDTAAPPEVIAASPPPPGPGAATAVQIAVGGDHSCARMGDGRVLCWGDDAILTLLAPRTSILGPRPTPTALFRVHDAEDLVLHGSQPVVRIAGDRLVSAGTWDVESLGTRAHGPEDWRSDALEIASVPPLTLVASASGQTLCVITAAGVLRCRGDNQFGQLGAGSSELATEHLLDVTGLGRVVSASHGGQTGCAITSERALFCFGRGLHGVLGDGTTTPIARTPVRVTSLEGVSAIAVSRDGHACALVGVGAGEGAVHCWGQGRYGELGDGALDDAPSPHRVTLPAAATRVAVGRYASCAIAAGRAYCWGAGNEGQLGDGRRQGSAVPVAVQGLDRLTDLALGDAHACALRDDGTVWCWGRNTYGNCAAPSGADTSVPVQVAFP